MMGRIAGSKNGVRMMAVRKTINVPIDIVDSVKQFMKDSNIKTFSGAVVQLIKYGIAFYYYYKDK